MRKNRGQQSGQLGIKKLGDTKINLRSEVAKRFAINSFDAIKKTVQTAPNTENCHRNDIVPLKQ